MKIVIIEPSDRPYNHNSIMVKLVGHPEGIIPFIDVSDRSYIPNAINRLVTIFWKDDQDCDCDCYWITVVKHED